MMILRLYYKNVFNAIFRNGINVTHVTNNNYHKKSKKRKRWLKFSKNS